MEPTYSIGEVCFANTSDVTATGHGQPLTIYGDERRRLLKLAKEGQLPPEFTLIGQQPGGPFKRIDAGEVRWEGLA